MPAQSGGRYFHFAIIADTHIIDPFYKGPEGNALDTETIFKTSERLTSARNLINSLNPPMEKVHDSAITTTPCRRFRANSATIFSARNSISSRTTQSITKAGNSST